MGKSHNKNSKHEVKKNEYDKKATKRNVQKQAKDERKSIKHKDKGYHNDYD